MSIPRELGLKRTGQGVCLVQHPIPELEQLRANCFQVQNFTINTETRDLPITGSRAVPITGSQAVPIMDSRAVPITHKGFELQAEFTLGTAQEFGFLLGENIKIAYDSINQEIFVFRSQVQDSDFHPNFAGRHHAKLPLEQTLHLRIFIDTCSVEVFVQHGEIVLTDLIFPNLLSTTLKLYAKNGTVQIKNLAIWELE